MLHLDENWKIDDSTDNVTLIYEKEGEINPKTNKPKVSRREYYYGNVPQALSAYSKKSLSGCETLKEVLEKLEKIDEKIKFLQNDRF